MSELNQIKIERREKLKKIQNLGVNAFPTHFNVTHHIKNIKSAFKVDEQVSVAGRLMAVRMAGKKASFANIQDSTGRIQFYINMNNVSELEYQVFNLVDIGDIVGIVGECFETKTGEKSIRVRQFQLLTKNLSPLPIVKESEDENGNIVRHDVFSDPEQRYRHRHIDLIVNPEVKKNLC